MNMLPYMKRDLADVIKNLEMGKLSPLDCQDRFNTSTRGPYEMEARGSK